MNKILFLSFLFCAKFLLSQTIQDTIIVNNTDEFLSAVQSNRVLLISAEHLELPDDREIVLTNIKNLTMEGITPDFVKITTNNTGVTVLIFDNSENIILKHLSIGHVGGEGSCHSNVISLINCKDVLVEDCDLFGSGYIGLNVNNSEYIRCSKTVIRDCSYNIVNDNPTWDINMDNCIFYLRPDNKFNYRDVRFTNCDFYKSDSTVIEQKYTGTYPSDILNIKVSIISDTEVWGSGDFEGQFENVCPNTIEIKTNIKIYSDSLTKEYLPKILLSNEYKGKNIIINCVEGRASYEFWRVTERFLIINGNISCESNWKKSVKIKLMKLYLNGRYVGKIELQNIPQIQVLSLFELFKNSAFCVGDELRFKIIKTYSGTVKNAEISCFTPECQN